MEYEFRPIGNDTEEDRMLNKLMVSSITSGFVEIGPDKFILTNGYNQQLGEDLKTFQVRDEDIFVASYPKTGSTWLQEIVYLIAHDLNYNKIMEEDQLTRLICLEGPGIINVESLKEAHNVDIPIDILKKLYSEKENPRTFKTHLNFSLLPQTIREGTKAPKILVPLRNPYDVCISYFHHSKLMYNYTGTFEQFCRLFLAGRVYFGHFWKHVESYWDQRHLSNVLFVQYSDMKRDLAGAIKTVAEFLGKSFSDDDIAKAADYFSFENMKKNPYMNQERIIENFYVKYNLTSERTPFVRSGIEGGYKTVMSPEMIRKFDDWMEENVARTGVTF